MQIYLRRSDETVSRIIRASFPGYTGQRIRAEVTPTVTFHGTTWDEGSKRDYCILRLADMRPAPVAQAPHLLGSPLHEDQYAIPDGFVVVVLVHFLGKQSLEILTPTSNITPALEKPLELTPDERTVLLATKGRLSSYAGQRDFRFQEARRVTGITPERYDAAKAILIGKKLLTKSGAITPEGRNAAGNQSLEHLRIPQASV